MPFKARLLLVAFFMVTQTITFGASADSTNGLPYTNTPVLRFAQVEPGVYRGAVPASIDEMRALKKLGIKTIINLQEDKKRIEWEAAAASEVGLQHISVPLSGFLAPSDKDANEVMRLLIDPALQPVFIHCTHGRERTGTMVALYRFFYGHWTAQQAYTEMKAFGFRTLTFPMIDYLEYRTGSDL